MNLDIFGVVNKRAEATQVLAATHEVHCQSQTHVRPFQVACVATLDQLNPTLEPQGR